MLSSKALNYYIIFINLLNILDMNCCLGQETEMVSIFLPPGGVLAETRFLEPLTLALLRRGPFIQRPSLTQASATRGLLVHA